MEFILINTSDHVKSHNPEYLDKLKYIKVEEITQETITMEYIPVDLVSAFNSFVNDYIGTKSNNYTALYPHHPSSLFIDCVYLEYQSVKTLNVFRVFPVEVELDKIIFRVIK